MVTAVASVCGYISATDAAKIIGCSRSSVCRAAKNNAIGVFAGGRLAAIRKADLDSIRELVHKSPGNPNWIAARGRNPKKRTRKKKAL